MVLQDTWLFTGTIRENIAFGNDGASDGDIRRAAGAAGITEYIDSLPDGYDTVLSDDGVNLSKGQKQLLTISRAMLSSAPILILDEATSNVDSRTEQQIHNRVHKVLVHINRELKEWSKRLGLATNLTTYVARHTYATVLKRSGVSVALISESLGHSDLSTTQIYLDSFENSQIDAAMAHLL